MSIPVLNIPIGGTFIKTGDTIPMISIDLGDAFDGDLQLLHIVRMQLYNKSKKELDLTSEANAGITITGEKTFEINKIPCNSLSVGVLKGDLQVEEYSQFGTDPIKVTTFFNVHYTIDKEYTIKPNFS